MGLPADVYISIGANRNYDTSPLLMIAPYLGYTHRQLLRLAQYSGIVIEENGLRFRVTDADFWQTDSEEFIGAVDPFRDVNHNLLRNLSAFTDAISAISRYDHLFKNHSNLVAMFPSISSTGEVCVAMLVYFKGYIPIGETSLPSHLDGISASIGDCLTLFHINRSKQREEELCVGCSIATGNTATRSHSDYGTLGAFATTSDNVTLSLSRNTAFRQ